MSNIFLLIASTLCVVLVPSQLFLGDALWRLPVEQQIFVAGIALACAATAAVAIAAKAKPLVGGLIRVGVAVISGFGALGLWLLLSRGFHSRPLLVVTLLLTTALCVVLLRGNRRVVLWLASGAALLSGAAQVLGDGPGHWLAVRMGAEVGARHKEVTLGSSLYTLRADVFADYFCATPTADCPSPRFGGALAEYEDGFVVATGEGQLYFVRHKEGRTLDRKSLPYRIPINTKAFLGGRLDGGGVLFRVTDIFVQDRGAEFRLFASHHYWHVDRQCFVLRLSSLSGSRADLFSQQAPLKWTTLFETQPCLPVLEPLPGSTHAGRLFSGDESGGRMALLDAQTMLLTVGDHLFNGYDRKEMLAQDPTAHHGKTLRIDLSSGKAEVFTLGHRNPQGLFVTKHGTVWQTEHGPRGGDELNRLAAGRNYGWPLATYGTDYASDAWPLNARQGDHQGFEHSMHAWVPSIAVSNLLALEGALFPRWDGDLLIGSYSKNLWRLRLRDDRVAFAEPIAVHALGSGRIRDLAEDKSGRIVLWIDGGTLAFLTPKASPTAGANGSEAVARAPSDIFGIRCGACHQLTASAAGPALNGIVDRSIAGHADFEYSTALRQVKGNWTEARLDQFLADPQKFASGTTMAMAGISDPAERKAIIGFLKSQK